MKTHGEASPRSAEYIVWQRMIDRCRNPHNAFFKRYGGRGICVHLPWADSFAQFLADMGRRPSPEHDLDRKDPDGNYEPGNCRWLHRRENRGRHRLTVEHCACGKWTGTMGHRGLCAAEAP